MKRALLMTSIIGGLAWLIHALTTSEASVFVEGVRYADVRRVSIREVSATVPRQVLLPPGAARYAVFQAVKHLRQVKYATVMPQLHDRFYLVELCTAQSRCQELEVVRTLKGEGVVLSHTGGYYLRNDSLPPLLDNLLK